MRNSRNNKFERCPQCASTKLDIFKVGKVRVNGYEKYECRNCGWKELTIDNRSNN